MALSPPITAPCHALLTSPAARVKKFPLRKFDEINGSCRAKGRFQDKDYCSSRMMDQIIAQGKDAIPVLISQIIETRAMKRPV